MLNPENIETRKSARDLHIKISPTKILNRLLLASLAFVIISLLVRITTEGLETHYLIRKLLNLLDVDRERSFPTAYSSFMLLSVAVLSFSISKIELPAARIRLYWKSLGVIFTFLTLDELFSFHETLMPPMRSMGFNSGLFHHGWVAAFIPVVCIFFAVFFRFWLRLPLLVRNLFLAASIVYVGGALGLEMIGGYLLEKTSSLFIYTLFFHLEEFCEMSGLALLLCAQLHYVIVRLGGDSFLIKPLQVSELNDFVRSQVAS